jgi:hypothetical protein
MKKEKRGVLIVKVLKYVFIKKINIDVLNVKEKVYVNILKEKIYAVFVHHNII